MPITTNPLKRPSAGGRLGRLLASLRPPARAGPLPVQTGFPTSLADLVVKNHGRLKNPRRRHRPSAAAPSPTPPAAAAEQQPQPPPLQEQRREVVTVEDAVVHPKGAAFSIRPELLAVGGTMALALLLIWSKWLVATATVASLTLFWIESVRSSPSRRRPRPEMTEALASSCGRGIVSPIREEAGDSEAETTPRSSCSDSDKGSLWAAADTADLDSIAPRRKEKRRSLRKLIAKKLRNGKRSQDTTVSLHGGESKQTNSGAESVNAEPVIKTEPPLLPAPAVDTTPPPDAITGERCRQLHGVAFPSAALLPIILVGLVAGKFPAVALTVLCAVFFTSVETVPSS